MEKDMKNNAPDDFTDVFDDSDDAVIDDILEEAKYYSEMQKAERRARLFAGDNAPEIFSTTDQKIKTTTTSPLDLTGNIPVVKTENTENAEPKHSENLKSEDTMNAARLMETQDEYEQEHEDFLNPEKVPPKSDVNENHADGEESGAGRFEQIFGDVKVKDRHNGVMLNYSSDESARRIELKSSSFYETVKSAYEDFEEEDRCENEAQLKQEQEEQEHRDTVKRAGKINSGFVSKLMGFFSTDSGEDENEDEEESGDSPEERPINDYTERGQEKNIFTELNFRIKSTGFKMWLLLLLTVVSVVLSVLVSAFPEDISSAVMNAPVIYALVNLALIGSAFVISLSTISNGLVPLAHFKGNSDTAAAVASVMCVLQAICALFGSNDYFNGKYSYYTAAVLAGLFANALGKRVMVKRIKENFKFITSRRPNFSVDLYDDERLSREMSGGTAANDPIVACQSRRPFLTDFLKLSYSRDKCELVCARLAPATLICTLVVGVLYGIFKQSFTGAVSVCAVLSAVSVPLCGLLAVNLPLRSLGKELSRKNAMISGYPAVVKFCQTNCVTVDASELYAKGVTVKGLKTYDGLRTDEGFIAAAAVLKEASSPIYSAFSGFLNKQSDITLPGVESWIYEDGLGLVAWVNNERVIIGSREIMVKYGVNMPPIGAEEKRTENYDLTYIAFSGELIAILSLEYRPQRAMLTELRRAELNGISVLVSTTDCNITQEKIAGDFDVYFRSVKVLSSGHTTVAREKSLPKQESAKAYVATKGSAASMLRVLSGCVRLKGMFNTGIVLQVISVILGVVIIAALCMFSSVSFVKTGGVLVYMAFWFAAIIAVQKIHRP